MVKEAVLLDATNARENDNLLFPETTTVEEAANKVLEWWPRVCRSDPKQRRRLILEAYDSSAVPAAALALYGLEDR